MIKQGLAISIALLVCFRINLNAQAPSDGSRAKLHSIIENVALANARRYDTKDNLSQSMDCAKIINNPNGGYLAVYHHYVNGVPKVFIASSANFTTWTMVKELASQASQPTIAVASDGGFVMAWEQEPGNHLKICYYTDLVNLYNATPSKTCDVTRKLSNCAEGTPSIYSASSTLVDVGFHYYQNCDVDRQARGTLTNFSTWTCKAQDNVDNAMLYWGVKGNIGDRDAFEFEGYKFGLFEGQFIKGDFGSWRSFIYDYQTGNAEQLNIATDKGSTAFANPTASNMIIDGKKALAITLFVPSEGAKNGEAGALIYYKTIENITTSINQKYPENEDISVFPNPVHSILTIRTNELLVKQVKISDMQGRVVYDNYESFTGSKTLDLSRLHSGLYTLLLISSKSSDDFQKSFLIQIL